MSRRESSDARFARLTLGAVLLGAATALAQPAPDPNGDKSVTTAQMAAERRQANALFKEGVRLFNATQFADALDLFENAYHRYPDARILYSIASTLRQLGKTVPAANAYQRYVDDPGAEPQFVADAKTVLHVLDATVGVVSLTFDGDPGEIQIVDNQWLPTGTKLVRVEPGSFIIRARKPGATAEVTGRVAPGVATDVTIKWTMLPVVKPVEPKPVEPVPVPVVVSPPPAASGPSPALTYGIGGGGAALGVLAIVLEVSSRGKISDAEAICGASLKCSEPAFSTATADLDAARTRRNVAIGLGVVGLAGIATGVYFYLQGHSAPKPRSESSLRVLPTTSDHAVGVLLDGRF
jgi:hypothetical protein